MSDLYFVIWCLLLSPVIIIGAICQHIGSAYLFGFRLAGYFHENQLNN